MKNLEKFSADHLPLSKNAMLLFYGGEDTTSGTSSDTYTVDGTCRKSTTVTTDSYDCNGNLLSKCELTTMEAC